MLVPLVLFGVILMSRTAMVENRRAARCTVSR